MFFDVGWRGREGSMQKNYRHQRRNCNRTMMVFFLVFSAQKRQLEEKRGGGGDGSLLPYLPVDLFWLLSPFTFVNKTN